MVIGTTRIPKNKCGDFFRNQLINKEFPSNLNRVKEAKEEKKKAKLGLPLKQN